MLRFLASATDVGAAANVGGPVYTKYYTFTDSAALEAFLRFADLPNEGDRRYTTRALIGVETPEEPQ